MIVLQAFAFLIVWTLIAAPLSVLICRLIKEARDREDERIECEREAHRASVVKPSSLDVVL